MPKTTTSSRRAAATNVSYKDIDSSDDDTATDDDYVCRVNDNGTMGQENIIGNREHKRAPSSTAGKAPPAKRRSGGYSRIAAAAPPLRHGSIYSSADEDEDDDEDDDDNGGRKPAALSTEVFRATRRLGPDNRPLVGAAPSKRLQAHGLPELTPLEPDWTCPGVPAGVTIEAEPCNQDAATAQATLYHSRLGQNQPHHVLREPFYFLCQSCHRKVERRELDILEHKKSNGTLSKEEEDRLCVLRARVVKKREQTNEIRKKAVAAKGLDAVQERERVKNRALQSRQASFFQENPAAYADFLGNRQVQEKKRIAKGGAPKAKGETRKIFKKCLYPDFFMAMLTEAAGQFVRLYGHPRVCWNAIVALFDKFLVREQYKEDMKKHVRFTREKNNIMYIDHAYRAAAAPFLKQKSTKSWEVIDATGLVESGMDKEAIYEEVVSLVYNQIEQQKAAAAAVAATCGE